MAILFVDMLGVRSRWQKGGRAAAEEAFQKFRGLVAGSLKGFTTEQVLAAITESVVEQAGLARSKSLGYHILSGLAIASGEPAAERSDYKQVK